jgi:hypothetical protein
MNSGMWITFLPSSGRADRLLAAGRDDPPLALFGGGDLMSHLNSYRND